jgi:two-component system phosphate regulon sensor histidine kinase PhoR
VVTRTRPRAHTRLSTFGVWILVAIPTLLILTCGILILVYQKSAFDIAIGLLLVLFCGALGGGVALIVVGIRRDRRLAALQIDFVSKVSHELKTPLTSIRMFAETLRMGRVREPERVQHCLEVISKETDRLSGLIGRLLSWGAMEAGAYKVDRAPRDAGAVVQAALDVFQAQAQQAQVELELDLEPELPPVDADEAALVDALLNLLTNALRYGGDRKKIAVSVRRRGADKVEISVQDWGIGIEAKDQRRIFERFYRADERYSRAVGGTGLGLAIARHIVTAHGGTIEVKSKVGEGSTFTVVLPVRGEGATG